MSEWLIAGIALLALFAYALSERRTVDRRSSEAWERATQQTRSEKAARPAPVKRLETEKVEAREKERTAS